MAPEGPALDVSSTGWPITGTPFKRYPPRADIRPVDGRRPHTRRVG